MDELDRRLRARLERLADAVPVHGPEVVALDRVARPVTRSRVSFAPVMAVVVIVAAAVLGVALLDRGRQTASPDDTLAPLGSGPAAILPSTGPVASPSTTPPAGSGTSRLDLDLLEEAACPHTEGGFCRWDLILTGPGGQWPLTARPGRASYPIEPGAYRLTLDVRTRGDVAMAGATPGTSPFAACQTSFQVRDHPSAVRAWIVVRDGSCLIQVDDGTLPPPPPADPTRGDVPLPYPEGCAAHGLAPRRCAYIVAQAIDEAGLTGQPTMIELLGDPSCFDPSMRCPVRLSTVFVVRVRVTPPGGEPSDHPVSCGLDGDQSLTCTDTPTIRVHTPMSGYHDVPCRGEGGDSPCATPLPTPKPAAIRDAAPLGLPSVVIAIDHAGPYTVDVGEAVLPNGILSAADITLADATRADILVPDGINLVITGDDGRPLRNAYDHGWRPGTERVTVRLEFTVEDADPGAVLELTDLVVR